ncbi:hypothetical protein FQA39_LY09452 [Lamprigera yunnana]|nr:hypothetical protein FQA39_LY09452 [Lamprigera yunnana]
MADYNPVEEAHLLQYNNASNEVLVDVTRYALDGDADKYIEMGYSTYLNLEPVIRIRGGCGDFGSGGYQALLNKNGVLLTAEEWKTLMDLEPYLINQFFHDSIEIQHILEQSFKDDLSVRNISRTGDISISVASSVFTITAMAVDRYLAITQPFSFCRWFNKRTTIIVIIVLWITSMIVFAPLLFVGRTHEDEFMDNFTLVFCQESWENFYVSQDIFGIICYIVMFAVPEYDNLVVIIPPE